MAAALLPAALVAGCATPVPPGPSGLVIADEPLAAEAAAAVLRQGGRAGDAAAALGLALAVTYPVATGLGGGGRCLAAGGPGAPVESIVFEPRTPAGGGPIAVPMQVAGLAYLNGRYGIRPWADVVEPARRLTEGFNASRAFVRRLAGDAALSSTPEAYALMFGGVMTDGQNVVQSDLGQTLAILAAEGPTALYTGSLRQRLIAASATAGGSLTFPDLAAATVGVQPARVIRVSGSELYVAGEDGSTASDAATALWRRLAAAPDGDPAALATEVWNGRMPGQPRPDLGATGFLVADAEGRVIVCALTMNGPFGARTVAGDLGFAFALTATFDGAGAGSDLLQPAILRGPGSGLAAAVAAGGLTAQAQLASALLAAARGDLDGLLTQWRAAPVGPLQSLQIMVCPAGAPDQACRYAPTEGSSGAAVAIGTGYGRRL